MTNTNTSTFLERLLSWSLSRTIATPLRYGAATLVIIAVGLFRAFLIASIVPWLLFIPFILVVGLLFGRAPGIYAAMLAAIVAGLSIGHASEPLWLTDAQWIGSALFVLISSGIAVLGAELRAVFARARSLTGEKDAALSKLAEREAFLTSVFASSTDCIKILDLDARLTFMSEGGQKVMEVSDFNTIVGCPWPDFWQERGNAEARAAIEAAKAGESRNFIGRASTMAGRPRWWDVAVSPVRGADGTTISRRSRADCRLSKVPPHSVYMPAGSCIWPIFACASSTNPPRSRPRTLICTTTIRLPFSRLIWFNPCV